MANNLPIDKEIALMIDVIDAAVMHGGDDGGAYYSDWFSLETAIGAWIKERGLESQYAPNKDSYLSPIHRISMSDIDSSEASYYILFYDDEIERFQEQGIATSRPGVPFRLVQYNTKQPLEPSFSCPNDKYGFYEVDYRRAEDDKACTFYQDCEDGSILITDVPVGYLKKIQTGFDCVDYLVRQEGFFVESYNWGQLSIRNEEDPSYYITLRKDGTVSTPELKQWTCILDESLSETIGDRLNLCKLINKLLWQRKINR